MAYDALILCDIVYSFEGNPFDCLLSLIRVTDFDLGKTVANEEF